MDPSKMKVMMRQLGIKQEEIEAERVVIECSDRNIIIEESSVQKIVMQGQESWQIAGKAREESKEVRISADDVKLVMEKTGRTEREVKKVLGETRDIAEAIVRLS